MDLKKKCLRWVKSLSEVWVLKVVGSATQASGVPRYHHVYQRLLRGNRAEEEDGKGTVSDIQKAQIQRIKRAKGVAEVVDSFDRFKEIVNDYIQRPCRGE